MKKFFVQSVYRDDSGFSEVSEEVFEEPVGKYGEWCLTYDCGFSMVVRTVFAGDNAGEGDSSSTLTYMSIDTRNAYRVPRYAFRNAYRVILDPPDGSSG